MPTTKQRRATQDADSSFPAKRSSRPSRSAILGEGKRDGWYRNKAQQKIVPQSTPYRITHQTIYLPVFYHLFNSAVKGCACDCPSGPKTKRTRRIRIHKRSQTAVGPAASTVFHSGGSATRAVTEAVGADASKIGAVSGGRGRRGHAARNNLPKQEKLQLLDSYHIIIVVHPFVILRIMYSSCFCICLSILYLSFRIRHLVSYRFYHSGFWVSFLLNHVFIVSDSEYHFLVLIILGMAAVWGLRPKATNQRA